VDLDKYIQIFFSQAENYLREIYHILLEIEHGPVSNDLVDHLMSNTHSIKGMARTIGFSDVGELSHGLESFIKNLPRQKEPMSNEIGLLFEGFEVLEQLIENLKTNASQKISYQGLLNNLQSLPSSSDKTVAIPTAGGDFSPKLKGYTHAQVKTETLDNLLNLVSETLLCQNRLTTISKTYHLRELHSSLFDLNELIKELHLQITLARMMPIKILTDRIARIIRNLAKEKKKEIEFMVKGEDLEIDRSILEGLEEPLIHIIRNAVDHGIEKPEERARKQKPKKGTIVLSISRFKENIVIQFEDDGKGMDPHFIKQKALEDGLITPAQEKTMSQEEALQLIYAPNFSTAETVTEVSGRGHGMFIVKNKVNALGGSIEISSQKDSGSKIIIRLPPTLSIMSAFIIKVGPYILAIPVAKVIANTRITPQEIFLQDHKETITFRKSPIFLCRLHTVLNVTSPPLYEGDYLSLVIVETGNHQIGLIVDAFVGQQEIVIRPLKPPLNHIKVFSGITLLGDGKITFLLNLEELL
jgi:Chemotaxis protein histidine kinase and related kinases